MARVASIASLRRNLRQELRKLSVIRKNPGQVLLWPVVCMLLCMLLWGLVIYKLDRDRREIEKESLKNVAALAVNYANFLSHTLEQLDQITLHLKFEWSLSRGTMLLDELNARGLFPRSSLFYVTIVDSDGRPRTSTLPLSGKLNMSSRESFQFLKTAPGDPLFFSKSFSGEISGRNVIHVARKLEPADKRFDGLVQISISPSWLLSFYDRRSMGAGGLLAAVGDDGALRASSIGGVASAPNRPAMIAIPGAGAGLAPVRLEGVDWFADGHSRFIARQTVSGYPFVAYAGLSEADVLAPWRESGTVYRNFAAAGSMFLVLSALMGFILSTRMLWRKQQAEEIRSTYRIATEGGNEGFYRVSAVYDNFGMIVDFVVEDCNERGAYFVRRNRQELLGIRFSCLYTEPHRSYVMSIFCKAMESGFYEDDFEVAAASPLQSGWMHRKLVRMGDGLAMTLRDISESKNHEITMARLINEDTLTRLPNRHWLINFLPGALQRAESAGTMLALLFIDLDDFKIINDTQGHSAGDEMLLAVAGRLRSLLRSADSVARLGGDEFTFIIENVHTEADVARVIDRVTEGFSLPFELSAGQTTISASLGASIFPRDGHDIETLLKNADIAMYSAKASGHGQHRYFENSLYEDLKQRLDLKQALMTAIEKDEFVVYYQPRIDLESGAMCSMEALLRWQHRSRGLLLPADFIPLAEETGLILQLGKLALEKTCAQLADWKQEDLPPIAVSVNVSARQFNEGKMREIILDSLARHGLDAASLEIELTESAMMGENPELLAELSAIRALGIKLLLDDFGTGYSSLSQLQRLEMDVLKVDRAFTAELVRSHEGQVFYRAIISMAHALGMRVVAEGVETTGALDLLRALECDEVQGFLISRPVPADEVPALLKRRIFL